jgi:hypothetical protein
LDTDIAASNEFKRKGQPSKSSKQEVGSLPLSTKEITKNYWLMSRPGARGSGSHSVDLI